MGNEAVGVRFVNVRVDVNGRLILDDINASAPCGSATVIIGPNGAGKTTLLNCLLGSRRYSGKIEFFLPDGKSTGKPRMGYVPQQLHIDNQLPLRVYEYLSLGRGLRPLWLGCSQKNRDYAREVLKLVDAAKLEEQFLGSLSGGEMRRVLLASALGRKPQLLILDEAEAGVDYKGERLFWELLDRTRREFGFTLIMVSHNLHLAAHYASQVICIKSKMLAEGAPRTTLNTDLLYRLFGVPIHLYPNQCDNAGPACAQCGAFEHRPQIPVQRL